MSTGARHARVGDPRARRARAGTIAVVWLAGLGAGLTAVLAALVRVGGCTGNGLACRDSGTTLGVGMLVAVVAVVTAVTVLTYEREPRRVLITGLVGVLALAALFLAARGLLETA